MRRDVQQSTSLPECGKSTCCGGAYRYCTVSFAYNYTNYYGGRDDGRNTHGVYNLVKYTTVLCRCSSPHLVCPCVRLPAGPDVELARDLVLRRPQWTTPQAMRLPASPVPSPCLLDRFLTAGLTCAYFSEYSGGVAKVGNSNMPFLSPSWSHRTKHRICFSLSLLPIAQIRGLKG